MRNQLFVNLPVQDLSKSIAFFRSLGFEFNPQFTDDNAGCMVLNEGAYVMLLMKPFFQGFTPKPISDARTSTEVLVSFMVENRAEVDRIVAKALAGGAQAPQPAKDYGFMYQHGFEDLDGHLWEVAFMDMSAMPAQS